MFNTVGTVLFMIGMTILKELGAFQGLWGSVADSGTIANFQTLFNLITAIALLPFTNLLVKIACKVVKEDEVTEEVYSEIAALVDPII